MKTLIIIVGLVMFGFAQNLLQNPGFEIWSGGMPDYWEKDDSIAIYQEGVLVHSGNYSVRDSLFTTTQSRADFFQTVGVQPNTEYKFSVWVWDNDPAGRIGIGIYWSPSGSSWPNIFSVDSTDWQELSFAVTSPSNAESATVNIRGYDVSSQWYGDAIFYIDDAFFEASAIQPPVINRVWHTPVNPGAGAGVDVYAKVTDDGTIVGDTLFYGINNLTNPIKLSHTSVSNDTFRFKIPGQTAGDTVFYCLEFTDNDGLTAISDTHAYFTGIKGIFINEVYYDTPGLDSGCFIEVYGSGGANLDGISLVGVNGNGGSDYVVIDLTGYSIPVDGFFVVAEYATVPNADLVTLDANLENGPDNLELRFNNIKIDALGYGVLDGWVFTGEWLPAPDVQYDHCLGRYPDGNDTDNNYDDFHDYTQKTPGEPNPAVSIEETKTALVDLPGISNPVRSGTMFASLIRQNKYYPIFVYNSLGQRINNVSKPEIRLNLPSGVYFLKLNNCKPNSTKIVIVK
jgi:hypothetical protein